MQMNESEYIEMKAKKIFQTRKTKIRLYIIPIVTIAISLLTGGGIFYYIISKIYLQMNNVIYKRNPLKLPMANIR